MRESSCVLAQEEAIDLPAILVQARDVGDPLRGIQVFGSPQFACVACHQVGQQGGKIGPNLSQVGKERKPEEIVESLLFPQKQVKPEYVSHLVVTEDGKQQKGYFVSEEQGVLTLKEPSSGEMLPIPVNTIEARQEIGSLMPPGLTKAMTPQQLADVLKFLLLLGHEERLLTHADPILARALLHGHGPALFKYERRPLHPELNRLWEHPVNRDRVYDFYTKQAEYFRNSDTQVSLLGGFPGLDGGKQGHWGNQNEGTWADGRWNQSVLGSLQSGVFRGAGKQVVRGICVQLEEGISACFDSQSLTYPVVWKNGFVKFSDVRHGFMHGLEMQGESTNVKVPTLPVGERKYLGLYRAGPQVVFHYRIGEITYLDAPVVREGTFHAVVAPVADHPLKHVLKGGESNWPQKLITRVVPGETGTPYVVDTIELPFENPWKSLLFFGGNAFLPDGSALLCTMQGDVWHVSGFEFPSQQATWRRFATGLHQPQGIIADADGIFVLGRDQITRLHDTNGDGEADYYECFSNVFTTSPAGHDYICGLERDAAGNFYTASGNQGLLKISPDGKELEVLATGFRNPDGLGISPQGVVTVPCSEGSWTPASMICAVPTQSPLKKFHPEIGGHQPPFFGLGGPRNGIAPDLPLVYLPRGLDNSSGGQIAVTSDRWGPLAGQMLHFSFGAGTHSLLLQDEVNGQLQGGIVPLSGEFLSGVHRGRFSSTDGQLYVSGMSGWGSYTPHDGCFQRVRYTGQPVQLPIAFSAHENGIMLQFSEPIDENVASLVQSHFVQAWNYRYSPGYGSPEFSTRHYGTQGHDQFPVKQAVVLYGGKSLFLGIPDLQPVNQLHIRSHVSTTDAVDLFLTIHALHPPFYADSRIIVGRKVIEPHPILKDVAYASKVKPNRWTRDLPNARQIVLETGTNLTFKTRTITVRAGEPLRFTLANPDVVPHNWALLKPGTLQHVGELSNKLIADPDAFIAHYIPDTADVLVHTDVVPPQGEFVVSFHAPQVPGRYPYLCTFPGHWMVMNGEMIVEPVP